MSCSAQTLNRAQALAATLLDQCRALLTDLAAFQTYLTSLGRPHLIEFRQFKSVVQAELKSLEKLRDLANRAAEEDEEARVMVQAEKAEARGRIAGECSGSGVSIITEDSDDEDSDEDSDEDGDGYARLGTAGRKVLHSLRSSNFPFYAMVWKVARTACTGLVGFSKKFYWLEPKKKRLGMEDDRDLIEREFHKLNLMNCHIKEQGDQNIEPEEEAEPVMLKRNVLVDIVADHGDEWVKVSTITPTRLLFELAKQGWELDSEDEGDEEEYRLQNYDSDDDDVIELVKLAADMKKAAAQTRVRYKHPRIRFVIPKVVEGKVPQIDRIIREIRKAGVTVECGTIPEDLPTNDTLQEPTPEALKAMFQSLIPSPYPHRTPTLNVDCTLLLALVSDLSHIRNIAHSPSHHRAITRQIELEAEKPLVPSELWPAMGDKELVCTEEAAQRMREIVDTIGTPTERLRTQLLMGETDEVMNREPLISQFQTVSDHHVPLDWRIPIRVINARDEINQGFEQRRLPDVARKVASQLSEINRSVFLYGWASGLMTLSSNRTVAKQIESLIEERRGDDDELSGPAVWICDTARSLVGKENKRKPQKQPE